MGQGVQNLPSIPTTGIGLPDYSVAAPIGSIGQNGLYTNSDPAELAARLGSYSSIDRRGNVLLHDNFENGVEAWRPQLGGGAGAAWEWSAESSRSGGFSGKLSSGLATQSIVRRYMGAYNPGKVGCEYSFATQLYDILYGGLFYSNNINLYYAVWRLEGNSLYVEPYPDAVITDVEAIFDDYAYNTIKMVWDTDTNYYTRIMFNQIEVDISKKQVFALPIVDVGRHLVAYFVIAGGLANRYVYIDDFLATVNEPVNT